MIDSEKNMTKWEKEKIRTYEVWADVILSCRYEVEAKSREEAAALVSTDDFRETRRIRATSPIVTSVEVIGENQDVK